MTNETRDLDAFVRQINALEIEVTKGNDGVLTVCSNAEPLFCYDANSTDEISELVVDTLASYGKHFFHIEGLNLYTKSEPIPEPLCRLSEER